MSVTSVDPTYYKQQRKAYLFVLQKSFLQLVLNSIHMKGIQEAYKTNPNRCEFNPSGV